MIREIIADTFQQLDPPVQKAKFRGWFPKQAKLFAPLLPAGIVLGEIKASTGAGSIPETVWIGFRTKRFARSNFRSGIYVAYLFSLQRFEVTLCLMLGVTGNAQAGRSLPKPHKDDFPEIESRVVALRVLLALPVEFQLSTST